MTVDSGRCRSGSHSRRPTPATADQAARRNLDEVGILTGLPSRLSAYARLLCRHTMRERFPPSPATAQHGIPIGSNTLQWDIGQQRIAGKKDQRSLVATHDTILPDRPCMRKDWGSQRPKSTYSLRRGGDRHFRELVARGMTNQEIGERTVANHVGSILGKLHLASRTQSSRAQGTFCRRTGGQR
jgi:hypothetical protein